MILWWVFKGYELSKLQGKPGTPERPLSDLGTLSYNSYWRLAILRYLHSCKRGQTIVSLIDIMSATSIALPDICNTLMDLGLVKYWKENYMIYISRSMINTCIEEKHVKLERLIDPMKIKLM